MKEFCAITTNMGFVELESGKLASVIEMVFILSEPVYGFDAVNEIVKSRAVSDVRFTCLPKSLRKLSEAFAKIADEAEAVTKDLNDQIAGDPPKEPA